MAQTGQPCGMTSEVGAEVERILVDRPDALVLGEIR